jgi:hypothetical protein
VGNGNVCAAVCSSIRRWLLGPSISHPLRDDAPVIGNVMLVRCRRLQTRSSTSSVDRALRSFPSPSAADDVEARVRLFPPPLRSQSALSTIRKKKKTPDVNASGRLLQSICCLETRVQGSGERCVRNCIWFALDPLLMTGWQIAEYALKPTENRPAAIRHMKMHDS